MSGRSPVPEQLAEIIAELKDEVRVLRDAVDELREELSWICNNVAPVLHEPEEIPRRLRVRSMSLDPSSPHFAVNDTSEEAVDRLRQALSESDTETNKTAQRQLF